MWQNAKLFKCLFIWFCMNYCWRPPLQHFLGFLEFYFWKIIRLGSLLSNEILSRSFIIHMQEMKFVLRHIIGKVIRITYKGTWENIIILGKSSSKVNVSSKQTSVCPSLDFHELKLRCTSNQINGWYNLTCSLQWSLIIN